MKKKTLALLLAAGMLTMMTALPAAATALGDRTIVQTGPNKISPTHNPETDHRPPDDPNDPNYPNHPHSPITDDMTANPVIPISVSVVCAGLAGVVYLNGRKYEEQ